MSTQVKGYKQQFIYPEWYEIIKSQEKIITESKVNQVNSNKTTNELSLIMQQIIKVKDET